VKVAPQVDDFAMNNLSLPEGRQRQLISECAARQQFRELMRFCFSQAHTEFGGHDKIRRVSSKIWGRSSNEVQQLSLKIPATIGSGIASGLKISVKH
jgi:hypothetical protein